MWAWSHNLMERLSGLRDSGIMCAGAAVFVENHGNSTTEPRFVLEPVKMQATLLLNWRLQPASFSFFFTFTYLPTSFFFFSNVFSHLAKILELLLTQDPPARSVVRSPLGLEERIPVRRASLNPRPRDHSWATR